MNLDNYLVELEKLKFYRDRISQQIIHSGRYPNQFELQHKLNDINLRIAIFQNKLIEEKMYLIRKNLTISSKPFIKIY